MVLVMHKKEKSPAGGEAQVSSYLDFNYNNRARKEKEIDIVQNKLLKAALAYAAKGKPIFPCKGKEPLTPNGYKNASADQSQIEQWWSNFPKANIAIPTGQLSGFWALDIDLDKDGELNIKKLEQEFGELPKTIEVITGGGGRHLYFTMPAEQKIPCSAGKIAPGIDVRGDGGYVIVPPSIHKSGRPYEWSVDCAKEITVSPEWLLRQIVGVSDSKRATPPKEWQEITKGVSEGGRNDSLARLSGCLLRAGIDPYVTLDLCHCWNEARCKPPLSEKEVIRTVDSIAGKELCRREAENAR